MAFIFDDLQGNSRASALLLYLLTLLEDLKLPSKRNESGLLANAENLVELALELFNLLLKVVLMYELPIQCKKSQSIDYPEFHSTLCTYRIDRPDLTLKSSNLCLLELSENLLAQAIQSLLFFCSEKSPYAKSKEICRDSLNCFVQLCLRCHSCNGVNALKKFFPGIFSQLFAICSSQHRW